MTEATWSGGATSPNIDWRMSAALENVPRNGQDLAEVTSLEQAVRAWRQLDPEHRDKAVLTPEHPVVIDGGSLRSLSGQEIDALVKLLPGEAVSPATD